MSKVGRIYQIVNDVNDSVYIGSTWQPLTNRMSDHRTCSKKQPKPHENPMYSEMRQFGSDLFRIFLLEEGLYSDKKALERREYEVMQTFEKSKLYNIRRSMAIEESSKVKMAESCKKTLELKKSVTLTPEERQQMFDEHAKKENEPQQSVL